MNHSPTQILMVLGFYKQYEILDDPLGETHLELIVQYENTWV